MTRVRTGQKQYPKTAPITCYLGNDADKARRLATLEKAAKLLGAHGASGVVQMVADLPVTVLVELLQKSQPAGADANGPEEEEEPSKRDDA